MGNNKYSGLTKSLLVEEGKKRTPAVILNMKMLKDEMVAKLEESDKTSKKAPAKAASGSTREKTRY